MNSIPTARDFIELPGFYLFKVIVKPEMVTVEELIAWTEHALGRRIDETGITSVASRNGGYRSYTLNLHMETYEEIEAVYATYRNREGVMYVL